MIMRMTLVMGAVLGILGCGPSEAEIGACKTSKQTHASNWSKYSEEAAERKEGITSRTETAQMMVKSADRLAALPNALEEAKIERSKADTFKAELDAYEKALKAADAAAKAAAMKASDARAASEKALEAAKAAHGASEAANKLANEIFARFVKKLRDRNAEEQKRSEDVPEWQKKDPELQKLAESAAAMRLESKKHADELEKDQRTSSDESAARIKEIIDLATAADKSASDAVGSCAKVDK